MSAGIKAKIYEHAEELGFDLVGICSADPPESYEVYLKWLSKGMHGEMDYMEKSKELRSNLNHLLPGVQSVISVGLNYFQPNLPVKGKPYIARYALGRDYHKVIRGKLRKLALLLEDVIPNEKWRACVDSAPILEREYANRAGLGWYGKNTCLINSWKGSWFLIGTLLTTAKLPFDDPASGGCGNCTKCIDACPTGAITQVDDVWQVDARNCISYLTIEKRGNLSDKQAEMIEGWTFGCDVCQDVCPFNQSREHQPERATETKEPDFLNRRVWPHLEELAQISEEEWDEISRGSPLRRAGHDGIRRNARANLQNLLGIEEE